MSSSTTTYRQRVGMRICRAARRTADVPDPCTCEGNSYLGVAHRGSLIAMHAGRKGTRVWRVGTVQAPQPVDGSVEAVSLGQPECLASDLLGSELVKAR